MNRRGFLGSIIAACAAPAIVRADSLRRIIPTDTAILAEDLMVVTQVTDTAITVGPLLTIDQITREALRIAHEKAVFLRNIDKTGPWVGDIVRWPKPQKMGDTIKIRMPERYKARA